MDAPLTIDLALAEDVYCEARAKRYIGAERVREVCDTELALWFKAERMAAREELQTRLAAIRALLGHLQDGVEGIVAKLERVAAERPTLALNVADMPEVLRTANVVFQLWRDYASQEMYGELLREGMDRCDFDVLEEAMCGLNDALKPFVVDVG